MGLVRSIIAVGVRSPVLANLLMVCMLVGGYAATRAMQRETYPHFSLDIIGIDAVYPGASPEDVERSVCAPLEEAIADVEGIYELTSVAHEGFANVWCGVRPGRRDVRDIMQEIKDRIGLVTTFPAQMEPPVVYESIFRSEVLSLAVFGDLPERTLKQFALEIKNDLRTLASAGQITLSGLRDDEIIVEVSEQALRAYNLSFTQVMAAVSRSSLDLPAGTLKTAGEDLTLRVKGQRLTAADYEELVVLDRPEALIRLGQIATVRDGFAESAVRGRFNGHPAVVLSVFKSPGQDTLRIAQTVRQYVDQRRASVPRGVELAIWGDTSREVVERLDLLVVNGLQGFALVFLLLWLFLEVRLAFWVAWGIPVAFSGALIITHACGQTLNMITLFGLLLASGMIVDDAIVIAESIFQLRRRGVHPELASIDGTRRVALPVVASSVTTIVAFVPLLFVSGVMGKFVFALPVVVIAAIIASCVEAFGTLPSHLCGRRELAPAAAPRPARRVREAIETRIGAFITGVYRPVYRLALHYRGVAAAAAAACVLVAGALVFSGRLPFVLLPKEDCDVVRARVRLPEGTPATATHALIERIERAAWRLNDDPQLRPAAPGPLVRQVYSSAGEFMEYIPVRGDNVCEVKVELMPAQHRRVDVEEVIRRWRAGIGEIHDAVFFAIARHQLTPQDEHPIEIRLLGDNLQELEEAGERIAEHLRGFAGVNDVNLDLVPGKRELQVDLKPAARALGLTLEDVAVQLRQGFFGGEAVKLHRAQEEVVVRVRYPEQERYSVAELERKVFRTSRGTEIPFAEAVDVRWARGHATIQHQETLRRVRVLADVDEERANAEGIAAALEAQLLPQVVAEYPGMKYVFGGTRHHINESLASLSRGFWVAMVAMYAIMGGMLRSYVQPVVVMLTIPVGMVGAVVGHLVLWYDLTIMSVFGIVALCGVAVNDALVLLDYINTSVRDGRTVAEAVYAAGEARFRAVVLTTVTTIGGLLPLLCARSSQAQSLIPLAISMSFGLAFATAVTLFLVPAVYLMVNDARRWARWLWAGGRFPDAEWVEEAYRERVRAAAEAAAVALPATKASPPS